MSIDAMKQALEALDLLAWYENPATRVQVRKPRDGGPIVTMYPHKIASEAAVALRAAIEQAQEPVAWMCSDESLMNKGYSRFSLNCEGAWNIPVYTAPRQWHAGSTTYKELLNKSEARLHEVAVHCERVERRLKEVNTAAMNLTHDLVCMDYDDDDRLNRDRVMGRIMQWRNEWDKAMFKERNT